MKHILFIAAALFGVLSAYSQELLENGSFEEFTPSTFMSIHSAAFDSWSFPNAWGQNVDSTDVIDGKVAFITTSELKKAAVLYQSVDCSNYAVADSFKIRICYKNLNDSTLRLCSYWAASAGSEPLAEEPKLNQELPYSAVWDTVEIVTAKPEGARNFEFRIETKAKSLVLLDNFSFKYLTPTEPYFTIIPEKENYSITAQINTDTVVAKIAIRQFNLTQPILLGITGTGKAAFSIDKTQVTKAEDTVTVRFKASTIGKYSAMLNINDDESPETSLMNRTIQLNGTAIDTTKVPIITVTPMEFDTFRCKAYEEVSDTIFVTSSNCYEDVHFWANEQTGPDSLWGFGISDSYLLKNSTDTIILTFAPKKAGHYTARLKAFTAGMDTIFINVAGVAEEGKPAPIVVDWDTTFVWKQDKPYAALDEQFNHADTCRNKTLKTTDWQNVVLVGERPWWGFYSDTTKQAKITSYYSYETPGTKSMENWFVTPALDYNNAIKQNFSFRVMGEFMQEEQTAKLEVYYIDATDTKNVWFQHIESIDTLIPAKKSELNGQWTDIYISLAGQEFIPEVFFMAFKFTDNGGTNGIVYYIDDVTWGIKDIPSSVKEVQKAQCTMSDVHKFVNNGQLYIEKNGKRYNVLGHQFIID